MESGSRRVFRYSSTHEKTLPHGSIRRRMEPHRAPHARPQRTRTAQGPQSPRDPQRHLLPTEDRMPVVAAATPRLPSMANRLLVLQKMAYRRHLGEHQSSPPRTPTSALEARSSAQRGRGGLPVGEEHRGRRGGQGIRWGQEGQGTKASPAGGHREGFVLKAQVHSAKVMDYEGIKTLLCARRMSTFLASGISVWLEAGYRGEDKGKDWALRRR